MLPPEQFHIKRRREEEPVETLYIQSELHQKKRRFTDFIFQRVNVKGGPKSNESSSTTATTALQDPLRSPRSVSTSGFIPRDTRRSGPQTDIRGVPIIRATSPPGAEFRVERIQAAESRRRETEGEGKRKRLDEPITHVLPDLDKESDHKVDAAQSVVVTPKTQVQEEKTSASPIADKEKDGITAAATSVGASTSAFPTSLRQFHISRPTTPLSPTKGTTGVSKKGSASTLARAILVEKLTRAPSLRGASVLRTLEKAADRKAEIDTVVQSKVTQPQQEPQKDAPVKQKRPVVNKAEKNWREQNKTNISAAKEHLATKFEPQDDDLDRLARELEEVMLDIEAEDNEIHANNEPRHATIADAVPVIAPSATLSRPIKFTPRPTETRKTPETAKKNEAAAVEEYSAAKTQEAESDNEEYVYDTYIRIPLNSVTATTPQLLQQPKSDITGYKDPLAEINAKDGIIHSDSAALTAFNIDPTRTDIGIVVITSDDEEIWDQYLEEDHDSDIDWDGEDVDSNAEDNPANDYPDEELSSADEYGDNPSIYRRYRTAASDDEEFDFNDFDDDGDGYDVEYKKHMYDYAGDDDDDDDE